MVEAVEAEVEAGSIAELREKALQEGELMPRSNLKEWQKDYHQGNLFIMKQHLMEAPPIKLMIFRGSTCINYSGCCAAS